MLLTVYQTNKSSKTKKKNTKFIQTLICDIEGIKITERKFNVFVSGVKRFIP